MAVKMRLRREGKKKQPFYRVVVADVRSPRDGRYVEDLGYYQPLHDPSTISIDGERALYWLRNGVQPTDAVLNLLRIMGIWEEFKPGDVGKDRTQKHAIQVAERDARDRRVADAEAEVARARAAAAADEAAAGAAAAEAAAEAAAGAAAADEAAAAQAHEENVQPDPGPTEDTGAVDEGTGEVTQP
jgi:small subunit ribosomal protein S16